QKFSANEPWQVESAEKSASTSWTWPAGTVIVAVAPITFWKEVDPRKLSSLSVTTVTADAAFPVCIWRTAKADSEPASMTQVRAAPNIALLRFTLARAFIVISPQVLIVCWALPRG